MATPDLNFVPVSSQNLGAVAYDPVESTLYITFNSGPTYAYYGVLPTVYAGLLAAGSKGRYFNENIRDVFAFEMVG